MPGKVAAIIGLWARLLLRSGRTHKYRTAPEVCERITKNRSSESNLGHVKQALLSWTSIERLGRDLRYGCRALAHSPGFTLVAVLSLAIGIGADSAIFSLADALLLRPLSVLSPADVVAVDPVPATGSGGDRWSYQAYRELRDQSRSFDGLVAFTGVPLGFSPTAGSLPQMTVGMLVTGNFFRVMGLELEMGRVFRAAEDQVPGRDAVVILSHDAWGKYFGFDRSILGRSLRLNGIDFTVIGVAPARFTGMDTLVRPAVYVPVMMWPRLGISAEGNPLESRDARDLSVRGRLKRGISIARAQAELTAIAIHGDGESAAIARHRRVVVRTELQERFAETAGDAILVAMLSALAAVVLLVACANVAGLLLSRVPARAKEVALRLSIGASRSTIIRQLLTESLVLALAGGAAGLAVAYGGVVLLRNIQVPTDLPIVVAVQLDHRAISFSLAVSMVSVLLFGLAPAMQTARTDLTTLLKSGWTGGSGRARRPWGRDLLVVGQVALSLVLLTVAAFLLRGFSEALARDPGFRTNHLIMMSFDRKMVRSVEEQTQQFYRQLAERVRSLPGVKSAALASSIPMGWEQEETIVPAGGGLPVGKEGVNVKSSTVDEGYFDTMGVRLLKGRAIRPTDGAKDPPVSVVNEEFVKRFCRGKEPIGTRFRLGGANGPWIEVVGVTKTGNYGSIGEAPKPFLYLPLAQHPQLQMTLLAESFGNPADLAGPMRDVVRELNPNQPVYDVRTMEDFYRKRVSVALTIIQTVGIMGQMGMMLALVGLYGLVASMVNRRTREIGIRLAIGAQPREVLRLFLRQGSRLVLSGLGVGLVLSLAAGRVLRAMFPGSQPGNDTYLMVALAMLAASMLAVYIPARGAARVDPMTTLRNE